MENERIYKVYMHENLFNGKKYVGITMLEPIRKRWGRGSGYKLSPHFYSSIKKYGWDNFKHEVLLCNLTKQEAEMFEVEIIKYYKTTDDKFGYNIANGGNSMGMHSNKTKQKMSNSKKGSKNHIYGKQHSIETINKISKSKSKEVINLNTGEIFKSQSHAANALNIGQQSISRVCNGLQKHAGGVEWAFCKNGKITENNFQNSSSKIIDISTNTIYDSAVKASKALGCSLTTVLNICRGCKSKKYNLNLKFI